MNYITRFKATNVYGWMDFDLSLDEGVNVIYGYNGTGKTTLIDILRALITKGDMYPVSHRPPYFESIYVELDNGEHTSITDYSQVSGDKVLNILHNQDHDIDRDSKTIAMNNLFKVFGRKIKDGGIFRFHKDKEYLVTRTMRSEGEDNLYWIVNNINKDITLLDCPEQALHVDVQRGLLPELSKLCNQIIVTTHSPVMLRRYHEDSIELIKIG